MTLEEFTRQFYLAKGYDLDEINKVLHRAERIYGSGILKNEFHPAKQTEATNFLETLHSLPKPVRQEIVRAISIKNNSKN